MSRKRISVQVAAAHLERFADVEDLLRHAGMTVTDQIPQIGYVAGVADESATDRLRAVPGVSSVRVHGEEEEPDAPDYSIS
jgi:hypothetical protein